MVEVEEDPLRNLRLANVIYSEIKNQEGSRLWEKRDA